MATGQERTMGMTMTFSRDAWEVIADACEEFGHGDLAAAIWAALPEGDRD